MIGFLVVLFFGAMSGAISYVGLAKIEMEIQTIQSPGRGDADRNVTAIVKDIRAAKVLTFTLIMLDFLVTVVVILILSNKFTDPIISLSTIVKEIGEGHWGKKINIESHEP